MNLAILSFFRNAGTAEATPSRSAPPVSRPAIYWDHVDSPGDLDLAPTNAAPAREPAPTIEPATAPAAQEKSMANKFVSFLEAAGKDVEKSLAFAVKEAPTVDKLAAALWPPTIAISAPATAALNLIQNSVIAIEQKYAAAGVQSGTGAQKAAEVLTLAGPAATQLLTAAGVPASEEGYVEGVIDAVVGVLNVQTPAPTPAAA